MKITQSEAYLLPRPKETVLPVRDLLWMHPCTLSVGIHASEGPEQVVLFLSAFLVKADSDYKG